MAAVDALPMWPRSDSTEDWVNFKLWGYAFPLASIRGPGLLRCAPHQGRRAVSTQPVARTADGRDPEGDDSAMSPAARVALEVIDESWQHGGHVGANGSGVGTDFRVRISSAQFRGQVAGGAAPACV